MAKIQPLTNEDRQLLQTGRGRKSRIAWGIIKQFEESGLDAARIESERPPSSLVVLLRSYIKKNRLNLEVRQRRGKVFVLKVPPKQVKDLTIDEVRKH